MTIGIAVGSYRNVQRLQTRPARPPERPVDGQPKKPRTGGGKAAAEAKRLEKERAEAKRWAAEQRAQILAERARQKRNRHSRERRKRRKAEAREQKKTEAIVARLSPDDRRYRPDPVDSVLVGKTRVTGLTAAAVKRRKTMTKAQWQALSRQEGAAHIDGVKEADR